MESFNQTIKNTLHFIAVIQDACDKKRLLIEKQNKQGYDAFVEEWKNEKYINPLRKAEKPIKKAQPEASLLEEDLEELALVDSLLEKARNIRLKTKNTFKKGENCTKSLSHGTQVSNNILKSSAVESQKQNISPKRTEEINIKRSVPRSKSASISTKLKTPAVPRSKSANVHQASNGIKKARSQQIASKPVHTSNGTINVQNTAILTNIELDEFKNLNSGQSVNKCKTKSQEKIHSAEGLQRPLKSDVKQYPDQRILYPTYRKFLKESQRISILKSSFRIQSHGLWYPFLNLKSKKYLLDQPHFVTLDSFTKAVKLIHQIQEAMLWIDLYSLIGRDAIPKLHMLDDSDWNSIRLCSFLESIYNENLQRTPVLDPN